MYLEKRHIRESTVLDCFGKFDDSDHDAFMETLEALHAEGCRSVVVNLSSVYQLSESIVHLLKFAHEYFTSSEGQFVIVSPLSSVRRDLDHAGITSTIPTYLSVYDALHRRNAVVNHAAISQEPVITRKPFEVFPLRNPDQSGSERTQPDHELAGVGQAGE